jgi:branched-chain amino acid transport system substrate-binding protein
MYRLGTKLLTVPMAIVAVLGLCFSAYAASDEVRIGAILPLTGSSSLVGGEMKSGAMIAMDEINSVGGVLGKKFDIIFEDSESRPAAGVEAAHKLIDIDKVPALIGDYSSSVTIAIQEYAQERKTLAWAIASSSEKMADIGDYCFNSGNLDNSVSPALARFAVNQGHKRAAIFAPDNDYGRGAAKYMKIGFEGAGGKVIDTVLFQVGKSSYRTEIRRVFAGDPDCVLYTAYGGDSMAITKEIYEMGLKEKAQFYDLYLSMCTASAIPDAVAGHRGLESWTKGPRADRLAKIFEQKTGSSPKTPYAAYAYDTVWLVALTMDLANSTNPDRLKVVAHTAARIYYGVTGDKRVDDHGQQVTESKGRCEVSLKQGKYAIRCPEDWQRQ